MMEQKIAALSQNLVKSQRHEPFKDSEAEYRSFCEGLPALLRTAGLAQALAFLRAKDGGPHRIVYGHMQEHFRNLKLLDAKEDLAELVIDSTRMPMPKYRLYSRLALQIAHWHHRMVQALLRGRKDGARP